MRGLRSIRRVGAALGIFALLLQLALAFGHIHADELLTSRPIGVAGATTDSQASPGDTNHLPGAPHDDCPICAVMHLAGTIVLPDPPVLVLPVRFAVVAFPTDSLVPVSIRHRLPFQTRAPPAA